MKQKKIKTDYFQNKSITITFKFKILRIFKKINNAKKSKYILNIKRTFINLRNRKEK